MLTELNPKALRRFGTLPEWHIRQTQEGSWRVSLTLGEKTWVNFNLKAYIAIQEIAVEAISYLDDLDRPYDYFESSVWD